MKLEIKPFTESTLEDFKSVVRNRFSEATTVLADKVMSNPVRVPGSDSGAIGYADGEPVCIRASIVRRVYLGKEPFGGIVGGLLAKKLGTDRSLLKRVVKNSVSPRNGSKIFFTNTSVKACVKLNKEVGVAGHGPEQWTFRNVAIFRPLISRWMRFAAIHPHIPKPRLHDFCLLQDVVVKGFPDGLSVNREFALDNTELDDFWVRYLCGNAGLVASRTGAEVNWAYGSRLDKNVIFFSLRKQGLLVGYIVVSFMGSSGAIWKVIDWIALGNNIRYLEILLREAVTYVRHNTPAVELTMSGFPECVQPIIAKYFKRKDGIGHNPYLFHCYDPVLLKKIRDSQCMRQSWFWGPYDGDMCME